MCGLLIRVCFRHVQICVPSRFVHNIPPRLPYFVNLAVESPLLIDLVPSLLRVPLFFSIHDLHPTENSYSSAQLRGIRSANSSNSTLLNFHRE